MKIIIICLLLSCSVAAQQVYEVVPGVKGNEITITLSNISSLINAENVEVKLVKSSPSLNFQTTEQKVVTLEAEKETDISFTFDVERSAQVNTADTIEFHITGASGVFTSKKFALSYMAPKEYKLEQNYPNPFNPVTTIQYQLPFDSRVSLRVYNILGAEVAVLADEVQSAGFKEIKFNANEFSSGVYVYRLSAGNPASEGGFTSIKKMMVLK